ncbi:mRNA transport regulator 3 [Irpex rosettiformis]|uniref:mRNA transport regulator 3 n=1 Tax=Irpex rosettiformis TaxID=378272 RepID=A0ACB8UIH3_9APHY|nr:mRNA transport regulator 3 [Irpex rosettiformis]
MSHWQTNFDRRRINGPEESFPPVYDEEEDQDVFEQQWKEGQPRLGRGPREIRPIYFRPGFISQANGSAYIETEKTKIACAVYGPRQSKSTTYNEKGKLNVEVKFTPFSCKRRRAPMRDAEDRPIATQIHQALLSSVRLELLPKSSIDIFVTIIENDGIEGCIAAGSIAASAALADAGIEMFGLVVSCSAAMVGKEIWLDPTEDEAKAATATFVCAGMPALGTITSLWQNGRLTPQESVQCLEACQERSTDIHLVVAHGLLESVDSSDG